MGESKFMEGKNLGILKVNTQKYQATQLAAGDDEGQFMISTAKKSSLKAKNICPRCQERVNKQEMKSCEHCGSELCAKCLKDYQKKHLKAPVKRDSSIQGN
ncbi:hypothetical protein [Syntrophomonas wolfei]|uniref:Uncharacterized protein n=1 Tax=Syntrophomonas wolfei subsp. wolfei (strain DSM 2245B / Goettingen) TaxID=335541 RepID=Q0B0T9_SYNWW|nr:hypothetical protein [Syntrophomonas wolfei]ABI67415.1 hypothetical protein Swol_0057 [Syntrophomonas wolfei subsp. wolfei str. Goettingen G311]